MKAALFVLSVLVPFAAASAEVRTGDSACDVRATLGTPRGQMKAGDRQILLYDRGEVELRGGAVTRVALLTDAEFAALSARRAAEATRLSERNAQGETLKASKLADSTFLGTPASYQLAFWQDFSRRFPGVTVSEQLQAARARVTEQYYEHLVSEERLAELEARVSDTEAWARRAAVDSYQVASYVSDTGYGYYGGYYRRYHGSQDSAAWPVQYQFARSPQPYATSPYPNRGSSTATNNGFLPNGYRVGSSVGGSSRSGSTCDSDRRTSGGRGRM